MKECTCAADVYKILEDGINSDYMEFRNILTENATHIYVIHDLKKQCFGDYEITGVIIMYSFDVSTDNYTIEINTKENTITVVNRTTWKTHSTQLPYNMSAEIENSISLIAMEG